MKKLELAYEIIKESKKSRALYLESGRDYHKVAANIYSIFECYAHGLIAWNTVRSHWHKSILEYLDLYKDNKDLYVMENNRMLAEYETTLKRFKPALDEYKKVSEAKMTSNIVIKKQISESVAKDQSNIYFNKRSLSESAIKDIAHTTDWKKVVESYPNLTTNDKDRLRMLTVFENDTFNVTGWSKLNEGPTLDTTQMITTVMSEGPLQSSIRPVARPGRDLPSGGYQWPNGAVEEPGGFNPLSTDTGMTSSPRPKARPASLGSTNSTSTLAPKTSIRPKSRPSTSSNVGRSEMSPNPGVYDGSTRGFESVQQEGYKTIKSIDKERYDEIPGLEGPFMTLSGKVVYYDPKEGSYYDRDTDMYLSYEEFKELDNDTRGMKEAKTKPGHNMKAMARAQEIIRKGVEQSKQRRGIEDKEDKDDNINEGVAESSDYAKRRKAADDEYYGKKKPKPVTKTVTKTDYQKRRETNEAHMDPKSIISQKANTIKEEVELDDAMPPAHKKLAYDVHKQLKRDEPMSLGTGLKLKASHKMLHSKYGSDWRKKAGIKEEVELDEAVTLDYSRHMRSHGRKPRDPGYSALWMFTTREYGMPDDDEMFQFQGSFADAKKAAAQWAKSQGAYRFYVME